MTDRSHHDPLSLSKNKTKKLIYTCFSIKFIQNFNILQENKTQNKLRIAEMKNEQLTGK